MRKMPHRNRLWGVGILFLLYTSFVIYSAAKGDTNEEDIEPTESEVLSANLQEVISAELTEREYEAEYKLKLYRPVPYVTWRPRRMNCTAPAIEQFPRPIMGKQLRLEGGLLLHVLVAIFAFLGLAIVCDDYFVASLKRICEDLELSPDVAGATFMAVGSSAPELATGVFSVFFSRDDIGISSGVIGSAVFNMTFVIFVCTLYSGAVCQLNWWPMVRDCFFYCLSILIVLLVIVNDAIYWYASVAMLLFYVVYCIILCFNTSLEKWIKTRNLLQLPPKEEQSALETNINIPDTSYTQSNQQVVSLTEKPQPHPTQCEQTGTSTETESQSYADPNTSWSQNTAQSGENCSTHDIIWGVDAPAGMRTDNCDMSQWQQDQEKQSYACNAEPQSNPLKKPTRGGLPSLIASYIVYPIQYACHMTMPDCRTERYRNWYPLTFIVSMMWISFYSYFMVWMITIIGLTLTLPDSLMGLTFVAIGVSMPDALNSIAVIKKGYGNMAISNVIGSNIFDILICLGLPWFIQTAIVIPGSHVNAISNGLAYVTLSLISTVVFLLLSTYLNGWKLDKRLGIILMLWYLSFIVVACIYELNIFWPINPPECQSNF